VLNVDPEFISTPSAGTDGTWGTSDDDYGDLRLSHSSPAINYGDNAWVTAATDLDGHPRIMGSAVDLGPYEVETNSKSITSGSWIDFNPEVCARLWFTNTGTLPSSVAITLTHQSPALNGSGLARRYVIVPTGGSGYDAKLELCYADADLTNAGISTGDEANLHAYRYDTGTTWEEFSSVDPVNNLVTAQNVNEFGIWGLGTAGNSPTAVSINATMAHSGSKLPVFLLGLLVCLGLAGMSFWRKRTS
jgi:hypothetical protein